MSALKSRLGSHKPKHAIILGSALGSVVDGRKLRNRRLFVTTETLDSDIAALAITGDNSQPNTGYSTPAAIGIPIML